jgi:hypothetical protein
MDPILEGRIGALAGTLDDQASPMRPLLSKGLLMMNRPLMPVALLFSCGILVAADMPGTIVPDASSGASCKITGGTATATSATVEFNEGHSNDILWCFWGEGTVTTTSPNKIKVTDRGRPGSVAISNLKPGTLYSVLLHGEGHGVTLSSTRYMAKGHFTTLASVSVAKIERTPGKDGPEWRDAMGRSRRGSGATGWSGSEKGGSLRR